jgi:hypothetical protein
MRWSRFVMKHAASRALYDYWEAQRGKRSAPDRADIEPGDIRTVLSDAFVLELDGGAGHPVRLAGTRVCALLGREVKGESFLDLWTPASRSTMHGLLSILTDESIGTIAGVTAANRDGDPIDLEMLLLPLSTRRPSFARAIGVLAPLKIPHWLGASPVGGLTVGSRRHVGCQTDRRIFPRFMMPRGRRGLTVHDGGRSLGQPG